MIFKSIPSPGQGLTGLVDRGDPAVGRHDPLSVVHAAHVRLVDELCPARQAGEDIAVDCGSLHLPEVGGYHAEHAHKLRHALVGGQPQRGGGRDDDPVLLGADIVRQGAVLAAEVGFVDDLVIPRHIVGPGDDLIQPHRLGGQGVSPVERSQRGGGIVADAGEIVLDALPGNDLAVAPLGDGDVGVEALVGHRRLDDLAGVLDLHLDRRLVQAVMIR